MLVLTLAVAFAFACPLFALVLELVRGFSDKGDDDFTPLPLRTMGASRLALRRCLSISFFMTVSCV